MLAFSLFLASCGIATQAAGEGHQVSGPISSDMVWEGEVTMAGDVLVLPGASLTIHAGTRVNVVPAEGTKIDPEYLSSQTELLVRGRLDIQGTFDAPVRFVVEASASDEVIAWAGITLDGAADSRIRHAVIERADIGIRCVGSSPEIAGNRIVGCRYGIVAQQQSHPRITGNTLLNGEGGVFCWKGSNPHLSDNHIAGNDEEALFVDDTSRPELERNTLSGNAIGLALYPRDLAYAGNHLSNNQEDLRWLGRQGQDGAP